MAAKDVSTVVKEIKELVIVLTELPYANELGLHPSYFTPRQQEFMPRVCELVVTLIDKELPNIEEQERLNMIYGKMVLAMHDFLTELIKHKEKQCKR